MSTFASTHRYQTLTESNRPQDETLDGSEIDLHDPGARRGISDTMPQVVEVTDKQGRSCRYVPIKENGKSVKSLGFNLAIL